MTRQRAGMLLSIPLAAVLICGCRSTAKLTATSDSTDPEAVPTGTGDPVTEAQEDYEPSVRVSMAYPTGTKSSSVVLLEKVTPRITEIGRPFDYLIEVTNLTPLNLASVTVTDQLSPQFEVTAAAPSLESHDSEKLQWSLGNLEASEKKIIKVTGIAKETGSVVGYTAVTYDNARLYSSVKAVKPVLELTVSAPVETLACDEIPIEYTVTNVGTGKASGVTLRSQLPEDLRSTDLQSSLVFEGESLEPGQSHVFQTTVKAFVSGKYTVKAVAHVGVGNLDDEALAATGEITTRVLMPIVNLTCEAPSEQYLGRSIVYKLTVENSGSGLARDTVLENPLPAGTELVESSHDGKLVGDKVVWELGDLAATESRAVTLTLHASTPGPILNGAVVRSGCDQDATVSCKTVMKGIPSILLDVTDVSDPTEVGENETYIITVTNHGTASGTGIRVNCEMEDNMEYVSSSGPTSSWVEGEDVSFAPLEKLDPGEDSRWHLVVKATRKGDARFTVKVQSDQLNRPILETEASLFFD